MQIFNHNLLPRKTLALNVIYFVIALFSFGLENVVLSCDVHIFFLFSFVLFFTCMLDCLQIGKDNSIGLDTN